MKFGKTKLLADMALAALARGEKVVIISVNMEQGLALRDLIVLAAGEKYKTFIEVTT